MTTELSRIMSTYTKTQLIAYLVDTQGDEEKRLLDWTMLAIAEDIEYAEGNFVALEAYYA